MRISTPVRTKFRADGFSMIEVLVVILILSFGMLGIAGLQANTAKFKINSWARSAASVQFSDLADRMRANPNQTGLTFPQAGSATSASGYTLADTWSAQQAADLTITTDCLATVCTGEQRAAYDMLVWRTDVRRMFPQGAAIVSGNRAAGITATIAWFDGQFLKADGKTSETPDACPANPAGVAPAALISCCPQALVSAGVRCTNISFVP